MIKLVHYKNSLMFSEVINCAAIELKFIGKFIGESKLSDDWYVGTGLKKIICVSFNGNQNVSELFEFQGSFTIIGIKIVTTDLIEIFCDYEKLDIDYFNRSKESFESGGSYFSEYSSTHESISTSDNLDIYKNNLFTKQDEFYHKNGENYFGKYHQHSNGQAMTESSHTIDSVEIFRKDQNNKLYEPKQKKLRKLHKGTDAAILPKKQKSQYNVTTGHGVGSGGREGESGGGGATGGYGG